MGSVHGKNTKILLATKDVSPFCKTSSLEQTADIHDTTGYSNATAVPRTKSGGLLDGKFTFGGTYDNTASVGPKLALQGLLGTSIAVVYNIEGTGTGKPNDAFSGILSKLTFTAPVDDMITWAGEVDISGAVVTTALP
jgi:hypothetical protein